MDLKEDNEAKNINLKEALCYFSDNSDALDKEELETIGKNPSVLKPVFIPINKQFAYKELNQKLLKHN